MIKINIDQRIIGCNDDLDGFPCIDCRFRDDESGCLEYRMTWNLTPFYDDGNEEYADGVL